jgi:hypothetical protein
MIHKRFINLFSTHMRNNSMIQLNDLNIGMIDIPNDESELVYGGDIFGAAIAGGSGFAAAGVVSGENPATAVRGAAAASVGNLIPVAANPVIGIPTAVVLGTAVGAAQALSATAAGYSQQAKTMLNRP